jgi:hypothetical protein
LNHHLKQIVVDFVVAVGAAVVVVVIAFIEPSSIQFAFHVVDNLHSICPFQWTMF